MSSLTMNTPTTPTSSFRVLYFFASWHGSHSQISAVFKTMPMLVKGKDVKFQTVDVDTNTTLTSTYSVTIVPTLIYLHNDVVWGRIEEGNPAKISRMLVDMTNGVQSASQESPSPTTGNPGNVENKNVAGTQPSNEVTTEMERRIKNLTSSSTLFVFIKGTPEKPKCGFSRQICEVFTGSSIPFVSFDILSDEVVRQGAKKVYDWPTYPMVFVKGELVGGLDIVKDMNDDGDLVTELGLTMEELEGSSSMGGKVEESVRDRIDRIVGSGKVVVFMKGIPSEPKCGFSRKICELLTPELGDSGYTTYNILEDPTLRSEIKVYKDWPTFPQVYVNGELVGGLDVVKDMIEEGEFRDVLEEE